MPWRKNRKFSAAEIASALENLRLYETPPPETPVERDGFAIFEDSAEVTRTAQDNPLSNLFPEQENISPAASSDSALRRQQLGEERLLSNLSVEAHDDTSSNQLRRMFPLRRVRLPAISTAETAHRRAGLFSSPRSRPVSSWSEPVIFTVHGTWRLKWGRIVNRPAGPTSKNEQKGNLDGSCSNKKKWRAKLGGLLAADSRPRQIFSFKGSKPGIISESEEASLQDSSSSIHSL